MLQPEVGNIPYDATEDVLSQVCQTFVKRWFNTKTWASSWTLKQCLIQYDMVPNGCQLKHWDTLGGGIARMCGGTWPKVARPCECLVLWIFPVISDQSVTSPEVESFRMVFDKDEFDEAGVSWSHFMIFTFLVCVYIYVCVYVYMYMLYMSLCIFMSFSFIFRFPCYILSLNCPTSGDSSAERLWLLRLFGLGMLLPCACYSYLMLLTANAIAFCPGPRHSDKCNQDPFGEGVQWQRPQSYLCGQDDPRCNRQSLIWTKLKLGTCFVSCSFWHCPFCT